MNRIPDPEYPNDTPTINLVLVPQFCPPRLVTVPQTRSDILLALIGQGGKDSIVWEVLADGNTAWFGDQSNLPDNLGANYLLLLDAEGDFFGTVDLKHRWVYDHGGERKIYRGAFAISGPITQDGDVMFPGTIAEFSARKYLKELG